MRTCITVPRIWNISWMRRTVRNRGWIRPSLWNVLEFSPSKYTGITGNPDFRTILTMFSAHGISSTTRRFCQVATSPAGNNPSGFPSERCASAARIPDMLFAPPLEKLSTPMKLSFRFGIIDRRKVVSILNSGLLEPMTELRIIPSTAPKWWLETVMKPPSRGM